MSNPIRILVVDDHTLFRRGLIALLAQHAAVRVMGEAGDAGEAQRRAQELGPDIILLDNHLPAVNGVDAIAGLRETAPGARILMLTVSEDADDLATALKAGAQGYLLKTMDGEELVAAMQRAMRGESVVSTEMTGKLVAAFQALHATPAGANNAAALSSADAPAVKAAPALSPREHEILVRIAQGASNKEIARDLDIAETTVKIHVQHILRKLNLKSRVLAAVYASEHGLI